MKKFLIKKMLRFLGERLPNLIGRLFKNKDKFRVTKRRKKPSLDLIHLAKIARLLKHR